MMDLEFPDEGLFGEMPGTPAALEEDCVVAARLTLEHVSLARSLGFASHPLEWFAFFTSPALIGIDQSGICFNWTKCSRFCCAVVQSSRPESATTGFNEQRTVRRDSG